MAKKAAPKAAAPKAKAAPAAKAAAAAPKKKGEAAKSKKPLTKAELFSVLADKTGVTKKQVSSLFDHLQEIIKADLGDKGPRLFVLPGLLKIKLAHKAATKEKKGINPFTKEPMTFEAKPARWVVKAIPLKALREMV